MSKKQQFIHSQAINAFITQISGTLRKHASPL